MKTFIKKISLRNFQSHRESDFELDPGLNIIVGPSDQGKSAIIRAIRWLVYNEPRGTGFIRVGQTRCQVRIELSNGVAIERIRDESNRTNRYLLEVPGQDAMGFERFNKEVPLEVRQALGMQKLVIDRDRSVEINLAGQLESPFLLEESGTTRSKILGRIANLHIIDAAQRDTLRDTSQSMQEIARLEGEVESLEVQLQDYADLEQEEARLESLEKLLARWGELDKKVRLLEEVRTRLEQNHIQMAETKKVLDQLEHIDEAYESQSLMGKLAGELQEIRRLQDQRNNSLEEIRFCAETIDSTRGIAQTEEWLEEVKNLRQEGFELQATRRELTRLEKEHQQKAQELGEYQTIVESLEGLDSADQAVHVTSGLVQKLELYKGLLSDWQEAVTGAKKAHQELQTKDVRAKNLADEYGDLLQDAGRCPTCFADINPDTIARIRREIL